MKFLKYLFILIILLAIVGFIAMKAMSEKEPQGQTGSEADALADKVMAKLNKPAFDSIPYLSWEFFRLGQKYLWDKRNNRAIIQWGDNEVHMNLNTQEAICLSGGKLISDGEENEAMKSTAWSNWCNDSFWVIAPFKMKDPGTSREIISIDDPNQKVMGLKVSYSSGGVTPGDAYLWTIGEDLVPTGWKMWTQILPVQGLATPWSGWEEHGGALFSTKHKIMGKQVSIKDLKAGTSWKDFGYTQDPFSLNK